MIIYRTHHIKRSVIVATQAHYYGRKCHLSNLFKTLNFQKGL